MSIFIHAEIRTSTIFGKGLFATEKVPIGKIICFFPLGADLITEEPFLKAVAENEQPLVRTGTRYVGRYYTHGNESEPYTYINHSFTPNLLCHCGVVMAHREIAQGEELTLDYRTLIDDSDIGVYRDAVTGKEIRGFSARQTLLRTTREVLGILEKLGEDWEG